MTVAISAGIAVWRYAFVARLPINLTIAEKSIGEEYDNGALQSSTFSYYFKLFSFGDTDIHIGKMTLKKRKPFCFHIDKGGNVKPFVPLPARLSPGGTMDIVVTIDRIDLGNKILTIREYGSRRKAKFFLPELEHSPLVPQ
jgi:hypothetical protein